MAATLCASVFSEKNQLQPREASSIARAHFNINMSEETQPTQPQQSQVKIDTDHIKSSYANVVGIAANINEVYLTFGVNTDPYNPAPTEPVKLDNRIIMTPDAAKRLCLNLNATLAAYEQRFGVIELDLQKRIRA